MKYLIIEDERFAYDELKRMMRHLRPDYELAGWAQSIEQAVLLLVQDVADLIIADIRLSDGMCFDAFERHKTNVPVIFTTAYDEYALKAFKLNSVDYLLKPVDESDLSDALDKFELNMIATPMSERYGKMVDAYIRHTSKNRFLIRLGDDYRYVPTADVAFFNSEDKAVYLNTFKGKRYIVDYSLDQLEEMIDGGMFFRVSRSHIANINAVKRVSRYFGGRLCLQLEPPTAEKIIVSRVRTAALLKWLDGGTEP